MKKITMAKKFKVKNAALPYQPKEQPEPAFTIIEDVNSDCHEQVCTTHKLYLKQEAMHQIARHIGWGEETAFNQVEQGGILLGQVFKDSEAGLTYGVVHRAVAGASAKGSSAYLEMTHETWKEMLDSVNKILVAEPEEALQIIGWYHTHPNHLSVFMSTTDQATQRRLFAYDWQFAMVLNPQKTIWRAFFGGDAQECPGFMVIDEKTTHDTPLHPLGDAVARDSLFKRGREKVKTKLSAWMRDGHTLQFVNCILLGLIVILEGVIVGLLTLAYLKNR
jgi:proteasome lid subunit RPN8/RPN11